MNHTESVPPPRVFVTGANGFIGRRLVERYRERGAEVCGVDLNADPECNVFAADVRRPGQYRQHLAGCDLVIHCAAVVSFVAPLKSAWDVNVHGTRRLLEACGNSGVGRFVQLSSVAALGFDFPADADEAHPLMPVGNSYVDTKIASEHAVLAAHAAGELECTVIRPGDVYGPASRPWVILPLEMMRANQVILPMSGKGMFSPVYIDDLVAGIELAAGHEEGAGQIFTLTSGVAVTCGEFFAHHRRWLGKRGRVPSLPGGIAAAVAPLGSLARIFGHPSELGRGTVKWLSRTGTYSIAKAERLLEYAPQVDLEEGMRRTEAWCRDTGLIGGTL